MQGKSIKMGHLRKSAFFSLSSTVQIISVELEVFQICSFAIVKISSLFLRKDDDGEENVTWQESWPVLQQ